MPTNPVFSPMSLSLVNQQNMLEDLIVQAIEMTGLDVFYVPRESQIDFTNNLLGEQTDSAFRHAYPIEMYFVNVAGFDGPKDVLSKFGWNIQSSTNLIVAARSFQRYIPSTVATKPREGDLIYVPMLKKLLEIKFADPDINFHAVGRDSSRPYFYELRTEVFKYSHEDIETGIETLDAIERDNSYTMALQLSTNGTGNYIIGEEVYQGASQLVNTASAEVSDWNPLSKLLKIIDIHGDFATGSNVKGVQSNTSYSVSSFNSFENYNPDNPSDNDILEDEAIILIDTSETNPISNT